MINISEIIVDPDFAQGFTVERKAGTWVDSVFTTTAQILPFYGVIIPLNTKDMKQLPEGDTIQGAIEVYTLQPISTTQLANEAWNPETLSDEIIWQQENYKIIQVRNFTDFGYFKAVAVRKFGA